MRYEVQTSLTRRAEVTFAPRGKTGATGAGVPDGGEAGQILAKVSDADQDTEWVDSGVAGVTNLDFSPSPTGGVVSSSSGADATLTPATGTNAGLMLPGQFSKIEALEPGSVRLSKTVGAAPLSGHVAVSTDGDGLLVATDRSSLSSVRRCVGITVGAASSGATAAVVSYGEVVESSWSWTPGSPVWCGPSGVLTQTVPSAPSVQLEIGVALTATSLMVRPRTPIVTA